MALGHGILSGARVAVMGGKGSPASEVNRVATAGALSVTLP